MNIPVIRLEINHMKHTIMTALTEYTAQLDSDIQDAVEAYCSEGHVKKVIDRTVMEAIDQAIAEEAEAFFKYGEGREFIKKAVIKRLGELTE